MEKWTQDDVMAFAISVARTVNHWSEEWRQTFVNKVVQMPIEAVASAELYKIAPGGERNYNTESDYRCAQRKYAKMAKLYREEDVETLTRMLLRYQVAGAAIAVITERLGGDMNYVFKLPTKTVNCGQSEELFCSCFELTRSLTPLAVVLQSEGWSYRTKRGPRLEMVQRLLEKKADPNLAWSEKKEGVRFFRAEESGPITPLERCVKFPDFLRCLISFGARPQDGSMERRLMQMQILAPESYWLRRRYGVNWVVGNETESRILCFFWVCKQAALPKLPREILQVIISIVIQGSPPSTTTTTTTTTTMTTTTTTNMKIASKAADFEKDMVDADSEESNSCALSGSLE